MTYRFDFSIVSTNLGLLLGGAVKTLEVASLCILFGFLLGLLLALGRFLKVRAINYIAIGYVEIIRNTPFIVQLFLVFYVLPLLGIMIDPFPSGVIALSLNCGGYGTEIIRAGIESIHHSQLEAAHSLGLNLFQTFRYVILKPALATMFPSLSSLFISVMLGSSVLSAISTPELTSVANRITAYEYRHFEIYSFIALLYLLMSVLFSTIFKVIELRFLAIDEKLSLKAVLKAAMQFK
jgi:polar amino acid transport system permease protein